MKPRRDQFREHDGRLTSNEWTIAMHGRCECKAPLYAAAERESGRCCDCEAANVR